MNSPACCFRVAVGMMLPLMLLGCSSAATHPGPTTKAMTPSDVKLALQDYWMDKPTVVKIDSRNFADLWHACRETALDYQFKIDRDDQRLGILTTSPMSSSQLFEPWRHDVATIGDRTIATLAPIRRTIRFDIKHNADGSYTAVPRVLVERHSTAERRITSVVQYHEVFAGPEGRGTTETDQGTTLPPDYFYTIGRDTALEQDLARSVEHRLTAGR